jgi:hypothetical protein
MHVCYRAASFRARDRQDIYARPLFGAAIDRGEFTGNSGETAQAVLGDIALHPTIKSAGLTYTPGGQ